MRGFLPLLPLGLLLAVTGCGQHVRRCACGSEGHGNPAAHLPLGPRGKLDVDWAKLPDLGALPASDYAGSYRILTEAECQCMAAQASSRAALLDGEARMSRGRSARKGLQEAVLSYSAMEARNQDAGSALEMYPRLAEAEARKDIVDGSLILVRKALDEARNLKKQGLRVPEEFEEFERQHYQLQADRAQADSAIDRLNRMLGKKLGMEGIPETERLWPETALAVSGTPVNVSEVLGVGLGTRPQLLLLRQVAEETNPRTLATVQKLLGSSSGLLGMPAGGPLHELLALVCARETDVRRDQVEELLRQREQEVAGEILQAAHDQDTATRLVAIGRERVALAQAKARDQEAKRAKGTVSAVAVITAQLALLKARSETLHEIVSWQIARIKLKEAQGLLVQECGYDPHHGHAHCGTQHHAEIPSPSTLPSATPSEPGPSLIPPGASQNRS
jgi:hypothetical protein